MSTTFLDWLDARTDYRRLLAPIRNRAVPGGPSWWLTSGSVLFWLFVVEIVTGLAATKLTDAGPR